MAKPNIDAELINADWTKRAWDFPTSVDEFLLAIGGEKELEHFLKLPAAAAMPKELRDALDAMEKMNG